MDRRLTIFLYESFLLKIRVQNTKVHTNVITPKNESGQKIKCIFRNIRDPSRT